MTWSTLPDMPPPAGTRTRAPNFQVAPTPWGRPPVCLEARRTGHLGKWAPHLAAALAHLAHAGTPDQVDRAPAHHPDALRWPQPVHRLDRVTSGWVCVALTFRTAHSIGAAFAAQRIRKSYLALVAGNLDGQENVALPLEGQAAHTPGMPSLQGPSLFTEPPHCSRDCPPLGAPTKSGRHCALLGHPIVGEDRYPDQGWTTGEEPLRYRGTDCF